MEACKCTDNGECSVYSTTYGSSIKKKKNIYIYIYY